MSERNLSPQMREEYLEVARQFRGTNAGAAILGLLTRVAKAEARADEAERLLEAAVTGLELNRITNVDGVKVSDMRAFLDARK